ncbi:TraR/DksA C4-type zinc finger protein [Salinisphaera sp. Q1T1-3]|uniref:TraR/DksA C4-type zinc finger protein n=1 Tax=Salinisphaera sp. Q1T1-3 TaxID=2321229 RepID=UPI000E75958B|nr:TraR/DksA C4-type zinc finger protein [Salinisphaera sp. Q1T1-3]RJS95139.1 RNA polymerase-binding protein DksA [Salinisphaera sp. Q1T1-3]
MTEDEIRAMPHSEYMNEAQQRFFRALLLSLRGEVLERERDIRERLNDSGTIADPGDRALIEESRWLDLRLRDREAKLREKIDASLRDIRRGDYGWCEISGEPIGIARLLARPTATTCADVKTDAETRERIFHAPG